MKINQFKWDREAVLYFVHWAAFEVRARRGECTSICCRIYPSGPHQDFISAAHNKSHRLCPQLAHNFQSDCLQWHAPSRSALHLGWINPSLLMSPFTPTLTLWYPVYIYAPVHAFCFSLKSIWMYNVFLWKWKIVVEHYSRKDRVMLSHFTSWEWCSSKRL